MFMCVWCVFVCLCVCVCVCNNDSVSWIYCHSVSHRPEVVCECVYVCVCVGARTRIINTVCPGVTVTVSVIGMRS